MPRRSTARVVAAVMAGSLLLVACDATEPGGDADGVDDPLDATAEGEADEASSPPDVATIDPDEVDRDAEGGIDGLVASASAELPEGWDASVVADPVLGPYVIGLPEGATVWRVGDDLGPVRAAATGTPWLRYWEPTLTEASEAVDSSSLRAAVVLPAEEPTQGVHLTITATPRQDLPVDDPAAVAERFAETFADQQLTVEEAGTAMAGDREVAALTMVTPDDEFDDGVARRLRQWFYPELEAPVLWSVTCEGPAPRAEDVDEVCDPVLASFRSPPR